MQKKGGIIWKVNGEKRRWQKYSKPQVYNKKKVRRIEAKNKRKEFQGEG